MGGMSGLKMEDRAELEDSAEIWKHEVGCHLPHGFLLAAAKEASGWIDRFFSDLSSLYLIFPPSL